MSATTHDEAVPLLQDYLEHSAIAHPDKVALVCGGKRYTYRVLAERAHRLAHALLAAGVTRGDRVLVYADNTPETVVSFWAILEAGAVATLINPLTKADKLAHHVADCRPVAIITDSHMYNAWVGVAGSAHVLALIVSGDLSEAQWAGLPKALRFEEAVMTPDTGRPPRRTCLSIDLAAIIYTSGSTGESKGVMLTHQNMLTAAASICSYLGMEEKDVILGVLPLSFDYGLYQMILSFRVGARLVLERSFAFPAHVLNTVVQEKVTGFPGVPTIFAVMAGMPTLVSHDFSSVRFVTNTAAALSGSHIALIRKLFPAARLFSMYGLTECKRCTYLPPEDIDRKPGSVGIAIPNTELWIVDEKGSRVGPGVTGELVIRGATVMQGYWEKPEATAEKLRQGPFPGERVLYTGDYCWQDEEGYLYFVGRMDDVFKSRGEKVAPKEIENVLVDITGVREAAVIGVPDEVLGQAIKAFVVLQAGSALSAKEIQRTCQSRLPNYLAPKFVEIVADLPKTPTGKIKKIGLS